MVANKQIKTLEQETNKIIKKAFNANTYACVSNIEKDYDLDLVTCTMRVGIYNDNNEVAKQVNFKYDLLFDLYSIKQMAALCASTAIELLDDLNNYDDL